MYLYPLQREIKWCDNLLARFDIWRLARNKIDTDNEFHADRTVDQVAEDVQRENVSLSSSISIDDHAAAVAETAEVSFVAFVSIWTICTGCSCCLHPSIPCDCLYHHHPHKVHCI